MGLSRNKVAVSEGAAGSPPFYGESSQREISRDKFDQRNKKTVHLTKRTEEKNTSMSGSKYESIVVRFSGSDRNPEKLERSYGGVAQLGEHLPCKQGVKSSNLFISTMDGKNQLGRTLNGLIAQQARALA